MNAAKIESSKRLQRVLWVLQKHPKGVTSARLADLTNGVAIATDVSELRARGYNIKCTFEGRTQEGRKIYLYALRGMLS